MTLKENLIIWGLSLATSLVIFTLYAIFIAAPINALSKDIAKAICQQMHIDCNFSEKSP